MDLRLLWFVLALSLCPPACQESEPETTTGAGAANPAAAELELVTETRPLMGTEFSVSVYAPSQLAATEAIDNAFAIAEEINQVASDYDENSELSRVNAAPHGETIPISQILGQLLYESLAMAQLTDGAFDPTLGPMTLLWRQSRRSQKLPSTEALEAARAASGFEKLKLSDDLRSLTKTVPGMRIDLGGIAKGFAAEQMFKVFLYYELPHCSIAAGGDLRVGDPPPGADGWPLTVRHRFGKEQQIIGFKQASASTSGDLYQAVEIDGTRYAHLIDPETGLGLTNQVSITVFAKNAVISDALATALCVLPEDQAKVIAAKFDKIEVLSSKGRQKE